MTFKVTTTDGALAHKGYTAPYGLAEADAKADAASRNERAEKLGIKARYEVREIEPKDLRAA